MSRMRTLDAGFAEFKASDPNTALTKNGLREMLLAGTIPSVSCGRKQNALEPSWTASILQERFSCSLPLRP